MSTDAYLYVNGLEWAIVEPGDCPRCGLTSRFGGAVAWCQCSGWLAGEYTALELLASFDHGLRTADETSWAVGTECVAQVCRAFFVACGIPFDSAPIDWSACAESAELTEPDGWCDEPDDSQALYDWCTYEAEPMFHAAGGIVETSADAGMTWLYIPIS